MSAENKDKEEAKRKFLEGMEGLPNIPPEERIKMYEELSSNKFVYTQNAAFNFNPFLNRSDVEITPEGNVVLRKPRVFLSHSHADKRLARSIYKHLRSSGVSVWFDEAELKFGDSLISKLRDAIDSVDVLLALISKQSVNSEWVKREIEIAMNQEIESRRVKVIPLLGDDAELPGFLVGKLYADLSSSNLRRKNMPKLAEDIKGHLKDSSKG